VLIRCAPASFRAALLVSSFLIGGCSIFDPDKPAYGISVFPETSLSSGHSFQVIVGTERHTLEIGTEARQWYSITRSAPREGELEITVSLNHQSTELARASFRQSVYRDWNQGVSASIGVRRPVGLCIGTLIVLPMNRSPAVNPPDTLFVTYGGLPKDAVC
jgi:hypothetical protein